MITITPYSKLCELNLIKVATTKKIVISGLGTLSAIVRGKILKAINEASLYNNIVVVS